MVTYMVPYSSSNDLSRFTLCRSSYIESIKSVKYPDIVTDNAVKIEKRVNVICKPCSCTI